MVGDPGPWRRRFGRAFLAPERAEICSAHAEGLSARAKTQSEPSDFEVAHGKMLSVHADSQSAQAAILSGRAEFVNAIT